MKRATKVFVSGEPPLWPPMARPLDAELLRINNWKKSDVIVYSVFIVRHEQSSYSVELTVVEQCDTKPPVALNYIHNRSPWPDNTSTVRRENGGASSFVPRSLITPPFEADRSDSWTNFTSSKVFANAIGPCNFDRPHTNVRDLRIKRKSYISLPRFWRFGSEPLGFPIFAIGYRLVDCRSFTRRFWRTNNNGEKKIIDISGLFTSKGNEE